MTATLMDGTGIAAAVEAEVQAEVARLRQDGIRPGLAVVLVGADPASASYVGMKARMCEKLGIHSLKLELGEDTTTDRLLAEIEALNADDAIDGILVQLPLPGQIDKQAILEAVSPVKDVRMAARSRAARSSAAGGRSSRPMKTMPGAGSG